MTEKEQPADGHYLELINNEGTWEVVHRVGELTDNMRSVADSGIAKHICQIRSAMTAMLNGQSAVADDIRLLPVGLDSKLADLAAPGSRVVVSAELASKVTQSGLLAYSAIRWFSGGHIAKLNNVENALAALMGNPTSFSRCQDLCDAGFEFIKSVPNVSSTIQTVCAGGWGYKCYLDCCRLGGP